MAVENVSDRLELIAASTAEEAYENFLIFGDLTCGRIVGCYVREESFGNEGDKLLIVALITVSVSKQVIAGAWVVGVPLG